MSTSTDAEHREEDDAPAVEDEDTGAQVAPIVQLEPVAVNTGEENEEALLDLKAKLYRFDKDGNQWKERGTGTVRILKHNDTGKVRLVMRQSKILKICANHLLLPNMTVQEHAGNEKSCVWHARDFADGELKDEFFCIRFASIESSIIFLAPPLVLSNIVEPAMVSEVGSDLDKHVSEDVFFEEFKKVAMSVAQRLKEQPVIVAHSENTFDGSGIKRLLSNKFELDKTLNSALENLPKDRNGKISKECLRLVLDVVAPSAGLPPLSAIEEMDKVVDEVFKMVNADDGKLVKEDEFKKLLTEILGSIMLQLEGNPISISSNSVVHEPLDSSSTLLQPYPTETP